MASPKAAPNPYARRSIPQRAKAALQSAARLPGLAWNGYKSWPKKFRIVFTVLALVSLLGASYYGASRWYSNRQDRKVTEIKLKLRDSILKFEPKDKVLEHCNAILEINPAEQQTLEIKKSVEAGEVISKSPDLESIIYYYVANVLEQEGRKDDLKREALKRIQSKPLDYHAHLKIAQIEVERRNYTAAQPHLEQLASPTDAHFPMSPVYLAQAMSMLKSLQRDVTNIRLFASSRIGMHLKTQAVADAEPGLQMLFLYLYCETFELSKLPPDAAITWQHGQTIADKCFENAKEKGDQGTIRNLAGMGDLFARGLALMRSSGMIEDAERDKLAAALESRTRSIWLYILDREPKNPRVYEGLIQSYGRTNQPRDQALMLDRGLNACGDDPQLLQYFQNFLLNNNKGRESYERLKIAAERNPDMPYYWILAAHSADRAGLRDLAIESLVKAREKISTQPPAPLRDSLLIQVDVMLANAYTGTGQPDRVLAALAPISDAKIATMPMAAKLLARGLAEIGDSERLQGLMDAAAVVTRDARDPQPVFYVALGLYEAYPPSPENARLAADYLAPQVPVWSRQFPPLVQLRAAALVRVALLTPGPVRPTFVTEALQALEDAHTIDPNHAQTVADIIFLRVRFGTEGEAKSSIRLIDPLVAKIDQLTPEQALSLAMALNVNKQHDDAVRVLESYNKSRETALANIEIAKACCGLGLYDKANNSLNRANNADLFMSERDREYYREVRELLSRVKQ